MKNHILFLIFFLTTSVLMAQAPRLIMRGDDMGFSHSGNEAMIACYQNGIETSIEVIVPSPWFPEAVKMLEANPGIDVGIHIALTSEWDNMKWRPVSNCPSLVDEDGYFYPFIWPNQNYPKRSLSEHAFTMEDVEKEMRAQIELGLKKIPRVSHISAHMGCYHFKEEIRALAKKLAKEYKIDIEPEDYNVKNIGYGGEHETAEQKIESLIKMFDQLKPGETYLFVDHPGMDSPELRAIHHVGYEKVAQDRQGVTHAWTSAKVKEAIRKKNIKLISYKDLLSPK